MSKRILMIFGLTALLTACGGGNDQPVDNNGYAYQQNGGVNNHNICPQQVQQHYFGWVEPACSQNSGQGGNCGQAIDAMRMQDAQFLQGPGCSIPTQSMHWCGNGNDWRRQAYVDLNEAVLQGWATQFGGPPSRR